MTASVNVERALREGNEALVKADKMKIDFVHHVPTVSRSPLTNIIVLFAEFLSNPVTGPLTERQHEYLGHITRSTDALLALIDNIPRPRLDRRRRLMVADLGAARCRAVP